MYENVLMKHSTMHNTSNLCTKQLKTKRKAPQGSPSINFIFMASPNPYRFTPAQPVSFLCQASEQGCVALFLSPWDQGTGACGCSNRQLCDSALSTCSVLRVMKDVREAEMTNWGLKELRLLMTKTYEKTNLSVLPSSKIPFYNPGISYHEYTRNFPFSPEFPFFAF